MEQVGAILPGVLLESLNKGPQPNTNDEDINKIDLKIKRVLSGTFGNIPPIFMNALVGDFDSKYNFDFYSGNLLILGKCGTGKTHLAVALVKAALIDCIKNGKSYPDPNNVFHNFQNIAISVKSSFKDNSESMEDVLRPLSSGLRIIDDVCTGKPTETAIEALYFIINRRYEYVLPTIYTSNLSLAEISTIYGDRIASRLAAGQVIKLEGNDRRVK